MDFCADYIVFLPVFLLGFLGGDMVMTHHHEDKHPNIRLDACIQADMRMLRFKSLDYIASFSFTSPKSAANAGECY